MSNLFTYLFLGIGLVIAVTLLFANQESNTEEIKKGLINQTPQNSNTIINNETKVIPFKDLSNSFSRTVTSATVKPSDPNVKIVNTSDDVILSNVSITFDANAKSSGALSILFNGKDLISIPTTGLVDVDVLNIPIPDEGLLFQKGSSIDCFFWNPSALASAFTLIVTTGAK